MTRVIGEQNYNKKFDANNVPGSKPNPRISTSASSYTLTPQQIEAQKAKRDEASRQRESANRAKVYTPEQRVEVKKKVDRANANAALSGGGSGANADRSKQRMR